MSFFGPPNIEKMKAKQDINGLVKACKNPDRDIAIEAAFALADLKLHNFALVYGILSKNQQTRIRAYTFYSKSDKYLIPLITSLHDEEELIRMMGLTYLLLHYEKRAWNPIVKCLHDSSIHVRNQAATVLAKLDSKKAINYLIKLRNDQDEEVRIHVNKLLADCGY
jgi:HEAT repeat protein